MINLTLEEEWENYRKKVLPTHSGYGLQKAKAIYFSGALTMILLLNATARKHGNTNLGAAAMSEIMNEATDGFDKCIEAIKKYDQDHPL